MDSNVCNNYSFDVGEGFHGGTIKMSHFPEWVRNIVCNISSAYQVTSDFVLFPLLTAVGTLAGKRVSLNDGKYINYPQLWTILIAPPASGKTEPLKWIYAPLKEIQKEYFENIDNNGNVRYIVLNDATIEARNKVLSENTNGIGIVYDEFAEYLNSVGRYGKNGEIANLLSIFSNDSFSVTRKGDPPIFIDKPFLSIVGGIQPGVLGEILSRSDFRNNGFITRFLWIESLQQGRARYLDASTIPENIAQIWNNAVNFFRNIEGREYRLSTEALDEYASYYDGNSYETDDVWREINGKGEIISLRLSLIIHLLWTYQRYLKVGNCSGLPEVTLSDMKAAIEIVQLTSTYCSRVISRIPARDTGGTSAERITSMFKNGMRQVDIAAQLGVSKQYVSKIVSGMN